MIRLFYTLAHSIFIKIQFHLSSLQDTRHINMAFSTIWLSLLWSITGASYNQQLLSQNAAMHLHNAQQIAQLKVQNTHQIQTISALQLQNAQYIQEIHTLKWHFAQQTQRINQLNQELAKSPQQQAQVIDLQQKLQRLESRLRENEPVERVRRRQNTAPGVQRERKSNREQQTEAFTSM
eukprot:185312_1